MKYNGNLYGKLICATTNQPIQNGTITQNEASQNNITTTNPLGEFVLPISDKGKQSVNLTAKGFEPLNVRFYKNGKLQVFQLTPHENQQGNQNTNMNTIEIQQNTATPQPPATQVNPSITPSKPKNTKENNKNKLTLEDYILIGLGFIIVLVTIFIFYKLITANTLKTKGIQQVNASLPQVNQSITSSITPVIQTPTTPVNPSITLSKPQIIPV